MQLAIRPGVGPWARRVAGQARRRCRRTAKERGGPSRAPAARQTLSPRSGATRTLGPASTLIASAAAASRGGARRTVRLRHGSGGTASRDSPENKFSPNTMAAWSAGAEGEAGGYGWQGEPPAGRRSRAGRTCERAGAIGLGLRPMPRAATARAVLRRQQWVRSPFEWLACQDPHLDDRLVARCQRQLAAHSRLVDGDGPVNSCAVARHTPSSAAAAATATAAASPWLRSCVCRGLGCCHRRFVPRQLVQ